MPRNGAIVITTKRGRAGANGWDYNNRFTLRHQAASRKSSTSTVRRPPRRAHSRILARRTHRGRDATTTSTASSERGEPETQPDVQRRGADSRINYRIGTTYTEQGDVIPNSTLGKTNVTGASTAQVTDWLNIDLSMGYTYARPMTRPSRVSSGPLLGLLTWPATDNAKDYLTPAGARRRLTATRRVGRDRQSVFQRQQEQDQFEERPHHRERSLHAHAVLVGEHQDDHRH